jgi:hypothetical protein
MTRESYDQPILGEALGADKTIMKSVIAITAAVIVATSSWASAQAANPAPTPGQSLADVARAEEARRKNVRKPARVFTNGTLKADPNPNIARPPSQTVPSGGASPEAPAGTPAPGTPGAETPAPAPDPGTAKDQGYWAGRIAKARAEVERSKMFAESLQSRINALTADAANRDYPSKGVVDGQRNGALAELEKVKKEIEAGEKAIFAIEEEARRAGVPPGWLRPGV